MRIEAIRKLIWGANVLVILLAVFYLYLFVGTATADQEYDQPEHWKNRKRGAKDRVAAIPQAEAWTMYGRLQTFPKDGLRPPPPEDPDKTDAKPEDTRGVKRVAKLISYWRFDPPTDESRVILQMIGQPDGQHTELSIGDKIPGSVWMLVDVEAGRAIFKHTADPEVEPDHLDLEVKEERMSGNAIHGRPVVVDGETEPGAGMNPGAVAPGLDAVEIGPGRWELGPREEEYLSDDTRIQEIKNSIIAQPWKNPTTGKYEGIKVRKVATNSYAAKRGVKTGDVLISINGVPVSNRDDVANYVRGPGKGKKQYIVKLLRNGQPVELTYNRRK